MIVVGAGTGGTVAGIGRKIKEKLPHVKVKKHQQHSIESLENTYDLSFSLYR